MGGEQGYRFHGARDALHCNHGNEEKYDPDSARLVHAISHMSDMYIIGDG
jgi:hypothetical protein